MGNKIQRSEDVEAFAPFAQIAGMLVGTGPAADQQQPERAKAAAGVVF